MKTERSDVEFPLWRKKVDFSLFKKMETPIPNWVSKIWRIERLFGTNTSKKNKEADVIIKFNKNDYEGWIIYTNYKKQGDTFYKLTFSKAFGGKLRDVFVMSYMRGLEQQLRKGNQTYIQKQVEEDIPFWEFIDIEFDAKNKIISCKAHYFQKPIFPELFKRFVRSHILKDIENELLNKGNFKFIKEDWKRKNELGQFLERRNIIYYLIDTKNKLLYIGESDGTQRISASRSELPHWDYFRVDCLPEWLTKKQRVELERLTIRSFASLLKNKRNVESKVISDYVLVNKKIDI
jgi:hypothetical protein